MPTTKYACVTCGLRRQLPERPETPMPRPSVGCERCGTIRPHVPVGGKRAARLRRDLGL